jgi:hypothetical protein
MRKLPIAARARVGPLSTILTARVAGLACAPPPTAAPTGGLPSTVTIRLEGDWPRLDVTGRTPGGGIPTGQVTSALSDALVFTGPDTQDPTKPELLLDLATSWDQTPTSSTFHTRTDDSCPDGTPSLLKQDADVRLGTAGIATIWGKGPFTAVAHDNAHTFTMTFGTPFSDAIYGFLPYNALSSPAATGEDVRDHAAVSPQIFWFSRGIDFFPGASWSNVRFLHRTRS